VQGLEVVMDVGDFVVEEDVEKEIGMVVEKEIGKDEGMELVWVYKFVDVFGDDLRIYTLMSVGHGQGSTQSFRQVA
jgi:hypothetical protein